METIADRIGLNAMVEEALDRLSEVAAQVRSTGSNGSITIKLNVKPGSGPTGIVVEGKVSQRSPEIHPPTDGWNQPLWEKDGELVTYDPQQPRLVG